MNNTSTEYVEMFDIWKFEHMKALFTFFDKISVRERVNI